MIFCCRLITKNGGHVPLTYKRFQNIISYMDPPAQPVPTITQDDVGSAWVPISEDDDELYGVPRLEELGKNRMNM